MATRLRKPVTRHIDSGLAAKGFRGGFVARVTAEGVYVKAPKGRWSGALLATWGDILLSGGLRKAKELKQARAAKRAARKGG